jgi:hypothetical protein
MDILTNPLFGVVTFLIGCVIGAVACWKFISKEWDKREALMKKTFELSKSETNCWIKAQIDADKLP